MMQPVRLRSTSVLTLVLMLVACAPTSAREPAASSAVQPPIPIRVGIFSFISYAPLYFAVQEGYFAEHGLDVELVNLGSSATTDAIIALASGELDASGYTLSTALLNAISGGSQLKYVADKGYLDPDNCPTNAWVTSNAALQTGLRDDPTRIRGKKVVVSSGDIFEYALDTLLRRHGLTQADVAVTNIADSPARIDALQAGSIDVSVLSEPWITRALKAEAGQVWIPFSEIIPNESLGTILYGPRILEEEPEIGIRFMLGYLRGVEQYNQGKTDRNVELVAEFTRLTSEDIRESCWSTFRPDGRVDTEGLLAFQQWAVDKGYVDEPLGLDAMWTSQFVDEAARQLGR